MNELGIVYVNAKLPEDNFAVLTHVNPPKGITERVNDYVQGMFDSCIAAVSACFDWVAYSVLWIIDGMCSTAACLFKTLFCCAKTPEATPAPKRKKPLQNKKKVDIKKRHVKELISQMKAEFDNTKKQIQALKDTDPAQHLKDDIAFRIDVFDVLYRCGKKRYTGEDSAVKELKGIIDELEQVKGQLENRKILTISTETAKESEVKVDTKEKPKSPGLVDKPNEQFKNEDNRCYLNSSLQALFASPYFRECVRSPYPKLEDILRGLMDSHWGMMTTASDNEKKKWNESRKTMITDVTVMYDKNVALHQHLQTLLKVLEEGGDPHTTIGQIRDFFFDEEMNWEFKKNGLKTEQMTADAVFLILMRLYNQYLMLKNIDTGKQLNGETLHFVEYDPIVLPEIHITSNVKDSFQQLIDYTYGTEKPGEDTKFVRDDGSYTEPIPLERHSHLQLINGSPPDFVPILLLRFTGIVKDTRSVPFSEDYQIDLSKAFDPKELGTQPAKYALRSVVRQSGSVGGGHYYAYARYGDTWHKCNDDIVYEIPAKQVDAENAYLYIYERIK